MAVKLNAYKVGDWRRAKFVFSRLSWAVPEVSAAMLAEAHVLKGEIVRGLWSGEFEQKYNWPGLAELTYELRTNPNNPILIDNAEYIRAIQVVPMGAQVRGVGILSSRRNRAGQSLAQIGLLHEFGGVNQTGRTVPARPFWRGEYARSRKRLYKAVLAVLARQAKAWGARTVRSLRGMWSSSKYGVGR